MDKDAAVIKALAELGLQKERTPSDQIKALQAQLDHYQEEMGLLNSHNLEKYLSTLD